MDHDQLGQVIDYMNVYRATADAKFYGSGAFHVEVHKLGGGTIGREYVGKWIINIYKWNELIESYIADIPHPQNHLQVTVAECSEYLDD